MTDWKYERAVHVMKVPVCFQVWNMINFLYLNLTTCFYNLKQYKCNTFRLVDLQSKTSADMSVMSVDIIYVGYHIVNAFLFTCTCFQFCNTLLFEHKFKESIYFTKNKGQEQGRKQWKIQKPRADGGQEKTQNLTQTGLAVRERGRKKLGNSQAGIKQGKSRMRRN